MQTPSASSLDALARATPAPERERAENAAGRFEQVFIQLMVESLRDSVGDSGLFGGSAGSSTYEDWFDQHLSEHLSNRGGIGIKQALLRDWERLGALQPEPVAAPDNALIRNPQRGDHVHVVA